MRAIDTNVLVRLLVRDDPLQVATAEEFVAPGAWITQVVLIEALWVLDASYGRSPTEIATAVERLLDHQGLVLQDSDVVTSALDLFRRRPRLGFADCFVLESARKAGHLPLGTFDRDLGRMDGAERL